MSMLGALLFAFGCAASSTTEDTTMQQTTIDGTKIELNAPAAISEAAIRPGSPAHDARAAAVTVTFRNESERPLSAPLEEIGNGLVLVYTVEGREPLIDNEIPPPPQDGSVITLAPGASYVVRLSFGYPQPLLPARIREPVMVRFCVRWREEWLRTNNYAPGAIQWNKSFDVCANVRITRN
jgi:hypothetical protein